MKFANMYDNARLAFKYGTYQGRLSGTPMANFTTGESIAIALGVPLEKVNMIWDEIGNAKKNEESYKSTGKKISRLFNDLQMEVDANGWGSDYANVLAGAIETLYVANASEIHKIEKYVNKEFITMWEQTMIRVARRDAEKAVEAQRGANE
jgi:hypothetical protein